MAVDTRDKRMSMLGLMSPMRRLLKNPTGIVSAVAREMLLFMYSGIPLAVPAAGRPRDIFALSAQANQPAARSNAGSRQSARSRRGTLITAVSRD